MRAVRCIEGAPAVVDVPAPSGDGVRVNVASAGICGSDLHLLQWNLPVVMGHELAGTLDDGTPVAVEPITPCGTCDACIDGDIQRCVLGPTMVFGVGLDGGMAEQCLAPESALVRLPQGVDPRDACLVEPLAVAVHGVRRGRVTGRDRVAVIGGGSIGLTAVVAARATGAAVHHAPRPPHQREAGLRLGAELLEAGDDAAGATAGDAAPPFDVVIEAVGTADALAEAVNRCRPGGTVVLLGTYWDGNVEMPGQALCMKEVTLVPAAMYGRVGPSRDVDVAAGLLAQNPDISRALITHRFPLDAAADAFAAARDRASGSIKVVLEP